MLEVTAGVISISLDGMRPNSPDERIELLYAEQINQQKKEGAANCALAEKAKKLLFGFVGSWAWLCFGRGHQRFGVPEVRGDSAIWSGG